MAEAKKLISIQGAREHNLKNISLELPRDRLIVFTGLSGSGKSSLAFDTIYAEGQRRYVESLSAYARQFLEMMQKPDVDQIDGLSPAISIEQKTTSRNPRSTVGTVTEIYDYLRLLFARIGIAYSPATGLPIESQTVTQMVDRVLELKEGTRLYLLAPIVRGRKGEYRKEIADLQKKGFQRIKVDGAFHEIDNAPVLDKKFKHDIDVVVDRIVVRPDIATRVADSLETALKLADGIAVAEFADRPLPPSATSEESANKSKNETHERIIFSQKFACPVSGFTIDEIEPRLFSFNNPFGACSKCDGLGTEMRFEPGLIVPDRTLSLRGGAVAPWAKTGATSPYYLQTLEALARHFKVSMTTPWEKLPKKAQDAILFGTGEEPVAITYDDGLRTYKTQETLRGSRRQHRAALAGNGQRMDARGTRPLSIRSSVRGLPGLPAQATGDGGEDRGTAHRPGYRHVDPRRPRLVRRAPRQAQAERAGNRQPHSQGNPRPPEVPRRCRARLPVVVAHLGHAVGRRKPAHPARLADRLGPDRRSLRAR